MLHGQEPALEDADENNEAGQFGAAQYADGGVVDYRKSTSSKTRSYFGIIKLLSGLTLRHRFHFGTYSRRRTQLSCGF